ncbi:hypothetical protein K504DRAFT_369414 [Pleomassaria siparia CBS 279.74]|uniref:40S ribosomal protein S12 n=1 Tax=Pleomassaria siparia CBS 279.74 TaxID=1314801 RepID=A0A6G1KK66_9PLEO|nr:hypothetical protein K504DRAFT_369414 [Pleomassaria siparia CBS 279.74]
MALTSHRQPPPVQQLTPPSSSHGGQGSWDFAVPVNNTKPSYAAPQPFMSEDVPPAQSYPSRQPLASQHNGYSKPLRSEMDSQRQYYQDEPAYLVPNRVNELHKNASGEISASNSDPDSVLEYYKGPETGNGNKSAQQAAAGKDKKKAVKPANWEQLEKDHNNWIHRDKLKEIESRELEEAGFRVGRSSRSNSRSQSAARMTRDRKNSELTDPMSNGDDDREREPRKRVVSTIPAADEEEDDNEQLNWDLRTPEEIAADNEQWAIRNNNNHQLLRPSTSRIPIAKMSPVPVPHTYVERDAPLPRSRKGSAHWSGDALATNGARMRSGSVSSQVITDDPDSNEEPGKSPLQRNFSNPTSPKKAKAPAKPTPASGARKTSALKAPAKPRNTSGTSPIKRPGTSGGSISRPTTSGHRPEGEAPWIATMYKPDPRLPPDQQIIPTHAKRIQQEQWESQGRVGSMYDRELRLLNDEFPEKRLSQIDPIALEKEREEKQWPLPSSSPTTKHVPERIDTNLRSPTNDQGSYKLTPTIPQSPRIQSRSSNHRTTSSTATPKATNTTRLPESAAADEKENKACCCISDGEEPTSPVSEVPEVEVSADASAGKGQMSVLEALKGVLKLALIHDGLARGLREASKALDRRQAHMCVLNEACEEEAYKKLVVALCSEHKIPLIKVPDGKQLGEWAGLCQIDREGNPRKVVNCSCVVVRDWGEESQERTILLNYFETEQ